MNKKPIGAGKSSFDLIDHVKLLTELDLRDKTFLDLACGPGDYSIAASEYMDKQGVIYAVDLWREGIENLKRKIAARHIENILPSIADISVHIPVENQSIDVCLMATVFHDLVLDSTEDSVMKEVKRILKPNGILAIVGFKKIEGPPGPSEQVRISSERLVSMMKSYDFHHVKTIALGPYNYLSEFSCGR